MACAAMPVQGCAAAYGMEVKKCSVVRVWYSMPYNRKEEVCCEGQMCEVQKSVVLHGYCKERYAWGGIHSERQENKKRTLGRVLIKVSGSTSFVGRTGVRGAGGTRTTREDTFSAVPNREKRKKNEKRDKKEKETGKERKGNIRDGRMRVCVINVLKQRAVTISPAKGKES